MMIQQSAIYQEIYHAGELRGELKGKLQGKQEGKLEGRLETQVEIALNLLKKGLTIHEIVEITGLSLDLVEDLTLGKMAETALEQSNMIGSDEFTATLAKIANG